jgi:hypothetical protein
MSLVRIASSVAAIGMFALVAGCGPDILEIPPTCVERPYRAEMHVDLGDPRKVWATEYEAMRDVAVRPRSAGGFTFDPGRPTTVLDAAGEILTFDGEITISGCFDAASQVLYIGPADVPDPNRPPN